MERKLASIETIKELKPIEGADFIDIATFEDLGWQCVVKKGEFQVGDKSVYFSIDSILPDATWSEFLGEKKRLRTKKFKGAISQGLALPLSAFELNDSLLNLSQGEDITELIGVTKYEPPMRFQSGNAKGNFPTYLGFSKTDETRVQAAPSVLNELHGQPYVISTKMDGTSSTALMINDEFTVCSRNLMLKEDDTSVYWKAAHKNDLKNKLSQDEFKHYVLQSEVCGPSIQGNKLGLSEIDMFVFNVFDLNKMTYLDAEEEENLVNRLGLKHVPIIEKGDFFDYDLETILAKAEGKYEGTKNEREGIVIRSQKYMYSEKMHGRMSFKAISNKFLLKNEEE